MLRKMGDWMRNIIAIAAVAALTVSARGAETIKASDAIPASPPATWITADDYPPTALRAGLQGISRVELDVGVDGRVTGCRVMQSSGQDILDRTTCNLLAERALFLPAKGSDGRPTVSHYLRAVAWMLPQDQPWPLADGTRHDIFVVNADGSLSACRVEKDGTDFAGGPCNPGVRLPANRIAALRDGAPAGPLRVSVLSGFAISAEVRAAHFATPVGWERVGFVASQFEVGLDGVVRNCKIIESRGSDAMFVSLCGSMDQLHFLPGKDVSKPVEASFVISFFREKLIH